MTLPVVSMDARLAATAMRTFQRIADAWLLTELEKGALLGQSADELLALASRAVVGDLQLETYQRVSYVIGIYGVLHTIFSNDEQADSWIRRPNNAEPFKGATALSFMCSGEICNLASVRQYLEGVAFAGR